jgi:hypothetical protein
MFGMQMIWVDGELLDAEMILYWGLFLAPPSGSHFGFSLTPRASDEESR